MRLRREMREELEGHIDLQVEANIASGMCKEDARRAALIAFGSFDACEEEVRDSWFGAGLDTLWRDVRIALRGLAKDPGFSLTTVLILGLAIGANTGLFSVVNQTLLAPLPFHDADRIMKVSEANQRWDDMSVSYPNYLDWCERQTVFDSMGIAKNEASTVVAEKRAMMLNTLYSTSGFLHVLSASVIMGRLPGQEDDRGGAPAVGWLTHNAWTRHFNSDPAIVGRTVDLGGQTLTIVGVLEPGFRYYQAVDLVANLSPFVESFFLQHRASHNNTHVIARLKKGVSAEMAHIQMKAIGDDLAKQHPGNEGISVNVVPLKERVAQHSRSHLLLLLGAVTLVLLIACVNVANILLARGISRSREIAIRIAVGATRRQIRRQLMTESLVLALIAGCLGVFLGWNGFSLIERLMPWEIRNLTGGQARFDWSILPYVAGISLGTGMIFGFAPAWRLSHAHPNTALKGTPGSELRVGKRFQISDLLIVAQVSLAFLLVFGAGLLIRSLQNTLDVPVGFRTDHLVSMRVSPPPGDSFFTDPSALPRFYYSMKDSISEVAGVEAVAISSTVPYSWYRSNSTFYLENQPLPEQGNYPNAYNRAVSHEFFSTLGIPLIKGRVFDGSEPTLNVPSGVKMEPGQLDELFKDMVLVAVINQRMADMYWPGEDPIGKRFGVGYPDMGLPWVEVIGVVGNTLSVGAETGFEPEYYLPFSQLPNSSPSGAYLMIRAGMNPHQVAKEAEHKIQELYPANPVHDVRLMDDRVKDFSAGRRFNMGLFSFFAGISLFLAAAGIYGVLSFITGRRTREIGIRIALGAPRGSVLRTTMIGGMRLVGAGLGIGVFGVWLLHGLIRGQLYGVDPLDPLTLGFSLLVLFFAAFVACLAPALRAASVDPMVALRSE
ncbi:MAG: ABC transporter permease [Opitutales bacterium]|nr:ABC transporter permease [Opitutales bacterium]